jgi:hypothetical protein
MSRLSWAGAAAIAGFVIISVACPAAAQEQRFGLGVRGILTASDGEPANDIPGFGVFGRYRLSDRWSLGLAVDQTEYDFEEPARLVGLRQDPALEPIDVVAEATVVSLWLQRDYARNRVTWFWGAGLGFASVDVPDATGRLASGGAFDIRTEADTEIIASLLAGIQRRLGERWFLEFGLRADQHFADWQLTDRVSGATGAVDDYLALGGHLGIGFRF